MCLQREKNIQMLQDLSLLTGATILNEDLGDDMDMITVDYLGTCLKSVTSHQETVLQIKDSSKEIKSVIKEINKKLLKEKNKIVERAFEWSKNQTWFHRAQTWSNLIEFN